METCPDCPVCGGTAWEALATRTYHKHAMGRAAPYVCKRLEVLFGVWFPDASEVILTSQMCERCGFVCAAPRPDAADIDAKYAFLSNDATTGDEISGHKLTDEVRSRHLLAALGPYLGRPSTILDFGGGNGRLMPALIASGHACALVDLPGEKLPGVEYLGARLDELPAGRVFDVVVASHVLEHLPAPREAVVALRSCVAPEGILYVEVPLEIWNGAPLPEEPVTHINYFTSGSLRAMLECAGYLVERCEEGSYTTEDGGTGIAIRAFARPGRCASGVEYRGLPDETRRLVRPGIIGRGRRALKYPALALRNARKSMAQHLARAPLLWRLVRTVRAGRAPDG